MAALAARRHLLLAVLLGLLSVVCHAADKPKQVEVDAYALVQVPGCNVGKPNSLVLPTGGSVLLSVPPGRGSLIHPHQQSAPLTDMCNFTTPSIVSKHKLGRILHNTDKVAVLSSSHVYL